MCSKDALNAPVSARSGTRARARALTVLASDRDHSRHCSEQRQHFVVAWRHLSKITSREPSPAVPIDNSRANNAETTLETTPETIGNDSRNDS